VNYDFWFLLKQFQSLSIGGKMAVVCGHILVLLIVAQLASFLERRRNTRASSMQAEFIGHPTIKCNQRGNNAQENENLEKPKEGDIIGSGLLSNQSDNRSDWYFHYQADGERQNHKWWIPKPRHIGTIVNRLRRRVNESGKEPSRVPYQSSPRHQDRTKGSIIAPL